MLGRLCIDAVRQLDLIGTLARGWLDDKVLNQPIRANGKTLEVEIGHRWYGEAKAQARAFDELGTATKFRSYQNELDGRADASIAQSRESAQ